VENRFFPEQGKQFRFGFDICQHGGFIKAFIMEWNPNPAILRKGSTVKCEYHSGADRLDAARSCSA
jgi:hypothetical protein